MNSSIITIAIIALVCFIVIYIVCLFNKLVKARNRVSTQWAQIDVQLVRRINLIPNLVEVVRGYISHEKELLEKITTARSELQNACSPMQAMMANNQLSAQLSPLVAVAEAYPNLKSDKAFISLQGDLKETEDKIAFARQFYNDTVLIYKNLISQFPSNLIAKIFHFQDESFYTIDENIAKFEVRSFNE